MRFPTFRFPISRRLLDGGSFEGGGQYIMAIDDPISGAIGPEGLCYPTSDATDPEGGE